MYPGLNNGSNMDQRMKMVAMAGVCPDVDGIGASFQMVTIYCRILLTDVTVNLSTIPTDM